MEAIIEKLLTILFNGGAESIIALLILFGSVFIFLWIKREKEFKKEREEIFEKFQKQLKDDREDLLEIIDKYQEGQLTVIQAINDLKILIATIGAKL